MSLFSKGKKKLVNFDNSEVQEKISEYLGPQSDNVLHSVALFDMGPDAGGGADVYVYEQKIKGVTYITGDLIGKKQKKSDAGNYELMICHKKENEWGSQLISQLSYYTLEASIVSGETMDIGPFTKDDTTAIIFDRYCDFKVNGNQYGLMLLIGINSDELEWAKEYGGEKLIEKLKANGVYPYTEFKRKSVL